MIRYIIQNRAALQIRQLNAQVIIHAGLWSCAVEVWRLTTEGICIAESDIQITSDVKNMNLPSLLEKRNIRFHSKVLRNFMLFLRVNQVFIAFYIFTTKVN